MKIFVDGADCIMCQISRIKEGFAKNSHVIVSSPEYADLIYCNNPPFHHLIDFKLSGKTKAKFIFCVLDLPTHLGDFNPDSLRNQLLFADRVVSISETTRHHLLRLCHLDSEVIYNPIKDVHFDRSRAIYPFRFGLVGRVLDPNKRASLSLEGLLRLGVEGDEVAIIGSEPLLFGSNTGVVSDNDLNDYYNSMDFLMGMSKNEGLFLPPLEALKCGVIPVLASDCEITHELYGELSDALEKRFDFRLDKIEPTPDAIATFVRGLDADKERLAAIKVFLSNYYIESMSDKFEKESVTSRIIHVFKSMP